MMQNYIDILRQLNYELVKELGLFKHRAGLSFSQRHILYHIKNNISLSIAGDWPLRCVAAGHIRW